MMENGLPKPLLATVFFDHFFTKKKIRDLQKRKRNTLGVFSSPNVLVVTDLSSLILVNLGMYNSRICCLGCYIKYNAYKSCKVRNSNCKTTFSKIVTKNLDVQILFLMKMLDDVSTRYDGFCFSSTCLHFEMIKISNR